MSFDAVVFPGQGSQRPRMAVDFAEAYPEARAVFASAARALSFDVLELCSEGGPQLDRTEYTQPCVLTAEIAMYETLRLRFGLGAEWFGGHSLGEYAALVAAGAIPFEVAVRLVHARGRLMQLAAPEGSGAMIALLMPNLPAGKVHEIAGRAGVDVANENSRDQLVLSGSQEGIDAFSKEILEAFGADGTTLVPLAVSAPFHSRHMAEAERLYRKFLERERESFDAARAVRVVSNLTGAFHEGDSDSLIDSLSLQISSPVRWRDNMAALIGRAAGILEIGPNRPLSGFFRSLGVNVPAVIDLRTARRAVGPELAAANA